VCGLRNTDFLARSLADKEDKRVHEKCSAASCLCLCFLLLSRASIDIHLDSNLMTDGVNAEPPREWSIAYRVDEERKLKLVFVLPIHRAQRMANAES
jgi:hypothetical protein